MTGPARSTGKRSAISLQADGVAGRLRAARTSTSSPCRRRSTPPTGPTCRGACRDADDRRGDRSGAAADDRLRKHRLSRRHRGLCGPRSSASQTPSAAAISASATAPERINPGDREHTIDKITKVIAGEDDEVVEQLAEIYGAITSGGVFRAASIKAPRRPRRSRTPSATSTSPS
jgi:hypothetical protein